VLASRSRRPVVSRPDTGQKRDFLFTQQQQVGAIDIGFSDWLPRFVDYVFLAFTNATAFPRRTLSR
jgi:hypothetical protein